MRNQPKKLREFVQAAKASLCITTGQDTDVSWPQRLLVHPWVKLTQESANCVRVEGARDTFLVFA